MGGTLDSYDPSDTAESDSLWMYPFGHWTGDRLLACRDEFESDAVAVENIPNSIRRTSARFSESRPLRESCKAGLPTSDGGIVSTESPDEMGYVGCEYERGSDEYEMLLEVYEGGSDSTVYRFED